MSLELAAIVVTSLLEVSALVFMGMTLRGLWSKTEADDAALYLQAKRVEEVVREMRAELLRR
jgi:hypothetical protein